MRDALKGGFVRAWTSIRDSHIAAILVSVILFWFGTSLLLKDLHLHFSLER